MKYLLTILIFLFITGCSGFEKKSACENFYGSGSDICKEREREIAKQNAEQAKKQACDAAINKKISEIINANDRSWSAYQNGEDERICPTPNYLGSYYVSECGRDVRYGEIYTCNTISTKDGYSYVLKWDQTVCGFNCVEECQDKSVCGSLGQRTKGWFENFDFGWGGDEEEGKENQSKPKYSTKCKTVGSQVWCNTKEY